MHDHCRPITVAEEAFFSKFGTGKGENDQLPMLITELVISASNCYFHQI